jgi:hypothetical protein
VDRLRDKDELIGEMRCALDPTNMRTVHSRMITDPQQVSNKDDAKTPNVTCAYRLG